MPYIRRKVVCLLMSVLALGPAPGEIFPVVWAASAASSPEKECVLASAPFDGGRTGQAGNSGGLIVYGDFGPQAAKAKSKLRLANPWGPKRIPQPDSGNLPSGIGPAGIVERPGYFRSLLGSLFGIVMAPLALASELVQACVLTPARMARAIKRGDRGAWLEPLRTAIGLARDVFWTSVGMAGLAAGPLWNAFCPRESADFMYANDRLIFAGGPWMAGVKRLYGGLRGRTQSWHTVFVSRKTLASPAAVGEVSRRMENVFTHEFVHSDQFKRSFLYEKLRHDFAESGDYSGAARYLNW